MSKPIIEVEGLSKSYQLGETVSHDTLRDAIAHGFRSIIGWGGARNPSRHKEDETLWALKDVSFNVDEGDVLGIIGRNGAGKSTLLKILSRITDPTSGKARIRGRVASLLEVGTGFHPELTGRENIFLNGAILGMTRSEMKAKFDQIVAFAEVERFIDTPVKRYSSGMYVRLAFAVAAHIDPEILIVDEVLAVGDVQFQKKCLGKMQDVSKGGKTVLFVSHNMTAISRFCTNCLLLKDGGIVSNGPTQEVIKDYLSSGMQDGVSYGQPHDESKEANLRKVSINPDGEKTSYLRYDRPILIRLEYEVNRLLSNMTVWIAIETVEGIMAFTSADYDKNSSMLHDREPGYYTADVEIPAKWLNYGQYVVIAGIVRNSPLKVYDRVEAIVFNIVEVGSPAGIIESGTRRGVFQPVLEWTNERR